MRKSGNHVARWLRPEFALSEPEQVHLMLAPHLHLEALLNGERDVWQIAAVGSLFNVALALAYVRKDRRAIQYYSGVQTLMLTLADGAPLLPRDQVRLTRALSAADVFICQQHKADVLAAIRLVEHEVGVSPAER